VKHFNTDVPVVLLVSPDDPDHMALRGILRQDTWSVLQAHDPIEAEQILSNSFVAAVIADSRCWKSLLAEMWNRAFPLIVADRLADERLWGEVLNLGAYDLVTKPFDATAVLHVLTSACGRTTELHGCSEGQPAGTQVPDTAVLAHPRKLRPTTSTQTRR